MITFLFGSGADTCANKNLKSGASFSEGLLTGGFFEERKKILGDEISRYRLVYPQSKKVFIQTINNYPKEAEKVFASDEIDLCNKYHQGKSKSENNNQGLSEKCEKWYELVTGNEPENKERKKKREFFLKNAAFFDSLDEKFNSLRDPQGSGNAKRVINAYLTVFLFMFKATYDVPNDFEWSYQSIIKYLNENMVFSSQNIQKPNYYTCLQESKLEYAVATTNYTDLLTQWIDKDRVAYLHGKLTWFEDLEALTVYDCTMECEKDHLLKKVSKNPGMIIPFILIPSGVKPVICSRQIKEFGKFMDNLEKSDLLIVIGYQFNSEDNHINSIIADWLRTKKQNKMLYFNFKKSVVFEDINWAREFERSELNGIQWGVDTILDSTTKIIDIAIDNHNAMETYAAWIEMLEKKELEEK